MAHNDACNPKFQNSYKYDYAHRVMKCPFIETESYVFVDELLLQAVSRPSAEVLARTPYKKL